jgi:hypothetical protein
VGVASVRAGFGHRRSQGVGASPNQNDLPAFFEQGEGAGFADAGAGTGDEGYFGHGENFLKRSGNRQIFRRFEKKSVP